LNVKRTLIARDMRGTDYNSDAYHIDHILPHSRGGSNTMDNLRILSKSENLRKGARKPKLRDWYERRAAESERSQNSTQPLLLFSSVSK
jgi:5-methylcytosine-specific restriction endonuclease McrA